MQVCELGGAAGKKHWVDTTERPNMGRTFVRLLNCLKAKEINASHTVSVATDRAPSIRGTQKGFGTLLQWSLNWKQSWHALSLPLPERVQRTQSRQLWLFTTCDHHYCSFQKGKNYTILRCHALDIDPSPEMYTFTGASKPNLEIELAGLADKALWVPKFKSLTAKLEAVARQKAEWSDTENLPKPNILVFETWNAIPHNYLNMKEYAFGVLTILGSM